MFQGSPHSPIWPRHNRPMTVCDEISEWHHRNKADLWEKDYYEDMAYWEKRSTNKKELTALSYKEIYRVKFKKCVVVKRIAFVNSKWACKLNDRQRITLKWLCPSEQIPTCNIAHVSLRTKPDTAKQYPSRVCLSANKYKDTQKEQYSQTSLAQRVFTFVSHRN